MTKNAQQLPIAKLSPERLQQLGADLADTLAELNARTAEKKESAKAFNNQIADLQEALQFLAKQIREQTALAAGKT